MSMISKLSLAGFVCAAIAAGTLVGNASANLSAAVAASPAGAMVALNPQPLPPGYRNDDEDDFRG